MSTFFNNYFEINILIELSLVCLSLFFLIYYVFSKQIKIFKFLLFSTVTILFLVSSVLFLVNQNDTIVSTYSYYYYLENNQYINIFKIIIYSLSIIVLILILSSWNYDLNMVFESLVIILLAIVGMIFFLSSIDLLMSFVSLELQTIALYILAASKKNSKFATEAALKYFIFSAFASALFALGCSIIYGILGTTNFQDIKMLSIFITENNNNLYYYSLLLGISLIFISFFFKLGIVPFHLWVADVYEGLPSYILPLFALVSKVAILGFFAKLYYNVFINFGVEFENILIFLSILSIFIGSVGALKQTKLKRLLAYSAITHMGFIILPLSTCTLLGIQSFLIYLIIYISLTLNLLLVLIGIYLQDNYFNYNLLRSNCEPKVILQYNYKNIINQLINYRLFTQSYLYATLGSSFLNKTNNQKLKIRKLNQLASLFYEKRLLASLIAFILFSLAGIPPLAGFFSKFYVLISLLQVSWVFSAILIVSISVIASFYYIRLIKIMFFDARKIKFNLKKSNLKFNNINNTVGILFLILATINIGFFIYPWVLDLITGAMVLDLILLPKQFI